MILQSLKQLAIFGGVGVCAACVHYIGVILLVQYLFCAPLVANIFAFLIAFQLSYFGHFYLTFKNNTKHHQQSLWRWLFIASSNFCLNEGLYAILLQYTTFGYELSLLLVLIILPPLTFLLAKSFAFRATRRI